MAKISMFSKSQIKDIELFILTRAREHWTSWVNVLIFSLKCHFVSFSHEHARTTISVLYFLSIPLTNMPSSVTFVSFCQFCSMLPSTLSASYLADKKMERSHFVFNREIWGDLQNVPGVVSFSIPPFFDWCSLLSSDVDKRFSSHYVWPGTI